MKKSYILVISLILVVLSMSCVSAGIFDMFTDNNAELNSNITLTNESTDSDCVVFTDDDDVYTVYRVNGIFEGLPDNMTNYTLNTSIYDANGSFIQEDEGWADIDDILSASNKSEVIRLGANEIEGFKNVSVQEVKIYDADGNLVFDKNITFDMGNVNVTYYEPDENSLSGYNSRILTEDELSEALDALYNRFY